MARGRRGRYPFSLPDGRVVGANYKVRGDYFHVQFPHPTEPGKYVGAGTGVAVPKGWKPRKPNGDKSEPPPDWHMAAAKLINKYYGPTLPADPKKTTWDSAIAELEKSAAIRPKTLVTYKSALISLRAVLPDLKGPSAVTPEMAKRFARLYAVTPYKRGKASDAKEYRRSAQTVFSTVANLSIVWNHFAELNLVTENPWTKVKRTRPPKRVPTVPGEGDIKAMFDWLETRYPGWELMRLFIEVKMLAGCRLNDLCQLRSDQIRGEILVILPEQDKTNRERHVDLPAGLAARLHAVKGAVWLWERYVEDTKTYRPGPCRSEEFRPSVMYNAVKSVFREYGRKVPAHKVKTHDLRKRALTVGTKAVGSVEKAARAFGIDPQTARRYYVDQQRAFEDSELFKRLAEVLLTPAVLETKS